SIESIFRQGSNDWETYNYSVSAKTKNFPKDQIQIVQFFNESDKNWDLARPHIENLRDLIINRKQITKGSIIKKLLSSVQNANPIRLIVWIKNIIINFFLMHISFHLIISFSFNKSLKPFRQPETIKNHIFITNFQFQISNKNII
ncbi:MAG: hypothetical protein IJ881_05705, partial [Neisseriaceae bacterium]|nr:hypothetical protein [Neisseriaceae bacterium]